MLFRSFWSCVSFFPIIPCIYAQVTGNVVPLTNNGVVTPVILPYSTEYNSYSTVTTFPEASSATENALTILSEALTTYSFPPVPIAGVTYGSQNALSVLSAALATFTFKSYASFITAVLTEPMAPGATGSPVPTTVAVSIYPPVVSAPESSSVAVIPQSTSAIATHSTEVSPTTATGSSGRTVIIPAPHSSFNSKSVSIAVITSYTTTTETSKSSQNIPSTQITTSTTVKTLRSSKVITKTAETTRAVISTLTRAITSKSLETSVRTMVQTSVKPVTSTTPIPSSVPAPTASGEGSKCQLPIAMWGVAAGFAALIAL